MEKSLFDPEPTLKNQPAVVIQSMLIGGNKMLAEVMWKKDFDELFTTQEH